MSLKGVCVSVCMTYVIQFFIVLDEKPNFHLGDQ